jgi:hypothetical protein
VPYVECTQLGIRVLVVDALFERAHSLLGLYCFGPDDVRDLEVEGDVFTVDVTVSSLFGGEFAVGLIDRTGCCLWPCLSAHPGQCWPLTTTTPSFWRGI